MMNEEIETLLKDRAAAVRAKDIERVAAFYQDGLRVFDLVDPLERHGKPGMIERLNQWLGSFQTIEDYSFADLDIHTAETIAVCSMLTHVKAMKPDQTVLDMWWRETFGMKKIEEKWLIIHTHSSVPFNPENGTASISLKPEHA